LPPNTSWPVSMSPPAAARHRLPAPAW